VLTFRRAAAAALVAGTGLAAVTGVGSAAASPAQQLHVVKTLPGDYIAPLQFAVSGRTVAVADSGASALYLVGNPNPIAHGGTPTPNPEQSGDLAGVDVKGGSIGYTQSNADHSDTRFTVLRHGKTVLQVSLSKYEKHHNPDGRIRYGFTDPSKVTPACSAQIGVVGIPVSYTGQVDSHPYAVAGLGDGSWLVADAGGNDILRISKHGHVSTVAVLPAQTVKLTAELAGQFGLTDPRAKAGSAPRVASSVRDGSTAVTGSPGARSSWATAILVAAGPPRGRNASDPAPWRPSPSSRRGSSRPGW